MEARRLGLNSGLFWWLALSAAAMLAGAFGPWAKVIGFVSVSGLDGDDGWFVLGAAVFSGAMVFIHVRSNHHAAWPLVGTVIAGCIAMAVAVADLTDLLGTQTFPGDSGNDDIVAPGWGIWMSALASASVVLAAATRFVSTGARKGAST